MEGKKPDRESRTRLRFRFARISRGKFRGRAEEGKHGSSKDPASGVLR